jgi:hypothetical protein
MATVTPLRNDESGKIEQKIQFIELRAKGYSYSKISKELHLAKSTLTKWNSELEEEIAALKAMELEALQEQYFLLKEGRIQVLGEITSRLKDEVMKRDLSAVPTDKLYELFMKYFAELKEEYIEVKPLSAEQISELKRHTNNTFTSKDSISRELIGILKRFRAGIIDKDQAFREASILQSMLKAKDQEEIEEKLNTLLAIIERRS